MSKKEEEFIFLANGQWVPKRCVDALDAFEAQWPGASFRGARAALAWVVINALKEED